MGTGPKRRHRFVSARPGSETFRRYSLFGSRCCRTMSISQKRTVVDADFDISGAANSTYKRQGVEATSGTIPKDQGGGLDDSQMSACPAACLQENPVAYQIPSCFYRACAHLLILDCCSAVCPERKRNVRALFVFWRSGRGGSPLPPAGRPGPGPLCYP